MKRFRPAARAFTATLAASALVATAVGGSASARHNHGNDQNFVHVGTFDVRLNGSETAEIVDATPDGYSLVYSDSDTGEIGFVDISDPSSPQADGTVDVGAEPTSVAVGKEYIIVATNTSDGDFDRPTGELVVISLWDRQIVKTFPLGGQPDSVSLSPNGRYAAIVLENERDEDENDGIIPQAPPGQLVVVDTKGDPNWWPLRYVDFTGLDMFAAADPEPEFVDINRRNQAVVSFQENNHLAVVDLKSGHILSDFPAGEVTLENVDATEEELGPQENGLIKLTETITKRREPDTVNWINDWQFATANEGDYEDENGEEGGSRSFTIFDMWGNVVYESFTAFEYASIRAGHYNEGRSGNKGGEPEALEFGKFGRDRLLFVGSERANVLGVYDVGGYGQANLLQLLPTGIGPEGIKAISKRNLVVVANEVEEGDIPSMLTIYERSRTASVYPQIVSSDDASGLPIPWVANSGMVADPVDPDVLYAVSDSILAEARIYRIDTSGEPAVITDVTVVTDPSGEVRRDLDLEGIAFASEGGFWLASEGRNRDPGRPNALVRVDAAGVVQEEAELPAELLADGWTNSGFEGVAVDGGYVYAVVQREWDSDAANQVKIARYDTAAGTWAFVAYEKAAPESPNGGWVGLSEITALADGTFAIIERDNQLGTDARVKKVYGVDLATADFQPYSTGVELSVVDKTLLADLLDVLEANSVWTPDKFEGLAVAADGDVYISTDNDGLDDAIGQTVFVNLGPGALGG